jgi:hypothetical protein
MKTTPKLTPALQILAREIKEVYRDLSHFEALSIAVQIERNAIIEKAFVLIPEESIPTALEAF